LKDFLAQKMKISKKFKFGISHHTQTMSSPSEMDYPTCEWCFDPTCQWNCPYERILFILNTYPKKQQKEALKLVPKETLKKAKELHALHYGE
jgi:hypothetical protein